MQSEVHSNALCHTDIYTSLGTKNPRFRDRIKKLSCQKSICHLKRDHFSRKLHLPSSIFQGTCYPFREGIRTGQAFSQKIIESWNLKHPGMSTSISWMTNQNHDFTWKMGGHHHFHPMFVIGSDLKTLWKHHDLEKRFPPRLSGQDPEGLFPSVVAGFFLRSWGEQKQPGNSA